MSHQKALEGGNFTSWARLGWNLGQATSSWPPPSAGGLPGVPLT